MPITTSDVIQALNDPALGQINFSVGPIKVNAGEFRNVADCIYAGDIKVTPGNEALAFYSGHDNELITQRGNPPLDFTDRAQLLHECTHAIVDINKLKVLRLHDEVAGYLTQLTYSVILNPSPLVPAVLPAGVGSPLGRLVWMCKEVVLRYDLHKPRGFGAVIDPKDILRLAEAVHAHPDYANVGETEMRAENDLGVPDKHLEMQRMRATPLGDGHHTVSITHPEAGRSAEKPLDRPRRKPAPRIRLR